MSIDMSRKISILFAYFRVDKLFYFIKKSTGSYLSSTLRLVFVSKLKSKFIHFISCRLVQRFRKTFGLFIFLKVSEINQHLNHFKMCLLPGFKSVWKIRNAHNGEFY